MSSNNQNLQVREEGPMSITPQERTSIHEQLDRLIDAGIGGSTHDPNVAAQFLEYANRKHILLSPVMGAFRLRPGWELAFTKLRVDTSKAAKMVYKVSSFDDDGGGGGGEWNQGTTLAFHKPMLNIIRTHLGIDMKDIVRVDDHSKRYCYEFKVFAEYLSVDGQIKSLVEQGGLDLSDGSGACKKIYNETRDQNPDKREQKARDAIDRKRAKVLQLATTNAEERLIVSYGFRGSYTKGELDSKFIVCVKPMFTGYHPDPRVQELLLNHMLNQQKDASSVLYGAASLSTGSGLSSGMGAGSATDRLLVSSSSSMFESSTAQSDDDYAGTPKECTPDECFGRGAVHVKACLLAVGEAAASEIKETTSWIVPSGRFKDRRVGDLTDAEVSSLLDLYDMQLEDVNYAERHAAIKEHRKHVLDDIERRRG